MKILVVEDATVAAKILIRELESHGHEATLAKDGAEGWERFQEEPFPLVITAWTMANLTGLELCQRIRARWNHGYTYVMIVTSKEEEDTPEAIRAGADDVLAKPLSKTILQARITVATRILQMHGQLEEQNALLRNSQQSLAEKNDVLLSQEKQLRDASEVALVARNHFSELFENLPVAGFTFDGECTIYEWNRKATEILTSPAHTAVYNKVWEVIGEDLVGNEERSALERVFDGSAFENAEWNNGNLFLSVSGYPIHGPSGDITGGLCTAVDVTHQRLAESKIEEQNAELKKINLRLEDLATNDGLTGIPNHRAFQERLDQFLAEFRRGRPFCLVMIDVDHFKNFNDRFGHQAGDEVLILVAQSLRNSVREVDVVARYGGEEFCALFHSVEEDLAFRLSDRLRENIEAIENPYAPITASFGVVECNTAIADSQRLISVADEALYLAKRRGRNQVVSGKILKSEKSA